MDSEGKISIRVFSSPNAILWSRDLGIPMGIEVVMEYGESISDHESPQIQAGSLVGVFSEVIKMALDSGAYEINPSAVQYSRAAAAENQKKAAQTEAQVSTDPVVVAAKNEGRREVAAEILEEVKRENWLLFQADRVEAFKSKFSNGITFHDDHSAEKLTFYDNSKGDPKLSWANPFNVIAAYNTGYAANILKSLAEGNKVSVERHVALAYVETEKNGKTYQTLKKIFLWAQA